MSRAPRRKQRKSIVFSISITPDQDRMISEYLDQMKRHGFNVSRNELAGRALEAHAKYMISDPEKRDYMSIFKETL